MSGNVSMRNGHSAFPLVHAKDHPILPPPSPWSVMDVQVWLPHGGNQACVLLVLVRDRDRLRLLFDDVSELTLHSGRPALPVRILDVTHLQWRGVAVRVETECGDLGFWAGGVVMLDGDSDGNDRALPARPGTVANDRGGMAR